MRIPLDYYRILSVPVKASMAQIEQAYEDRLLQQPRREYNDQAIEARQKLIQQAYQVLSNAEQRSEYDAQFFVSMQPASFPAADLRDGADMLNIEANPEAGTEESSADTEAATFEDAPPPPVINPTIEVEPDQLIGALLILHELGEYEIALQLSADYFNSPEFIKPNQEESIRTDTQENIILSLTLAYLELGREQWHRQEYENAATSSQMGIDLLERENLFLQIKEELHLDLYKLRPYRVLELISQNKANSAQRIKGFKLLREMLVQRQGIESKGQDRSGLNFDQFLCFVQQLRTYLTSAEQQELFDHQSQNSSAIANYLAVYALLARGFSLKQPELILRAQRKLDYLSVKQDVAWEQAVSALLLGHTEKAIGKVQQSQDTEKLEQILQHSALNADLPSADLLSGMCFYGEQWLHEDVIAQFPDLSSCSLTLKEYFADPEVQKYLEELVPDTALTSPQVVAANQKNQTIQRNDAAVPQASTGIFSRWRSIFNVDKTVAKASSQSVQSEKELVGAVAGSRQQATNVGSHKAAGVSGKSRSKSGHKFTENKSRVKSGSKAVNKPRFRQTFPHNSPPSLSNASPTTPTNSTLKSPSLPLQPQQRAVPPAVMQKANGRVIQRRVARKKKLKAATFWRGWLFIFCLMAGFSALAFSVVKLFLNPDLKTVHKSQLAIAVTQPAVTLPTVKPKPVAVKPQVTFTEQAQQVVTKWLDGKSAAFGKEHKVERLNDILAEPLLTTWRDRALVHEQSDSYREYEHEITMRSAKIDANNPRKATIEAEVKEVAKHYQSGQLDNAQSYDDNLLVRYQLILKEGSWLIQNAEVLQTL